MMTITRTKEWLCSKAHMRRSVTPESLSPILWFAILWAHYENTCCKKRCFPKTIKAHLDAIDASGIEIQEWGPLKSRYREKFSESSGFGVFCRKFGAVGDVKLDIRKAFNDESCSDVDFMYAMLLIVYRVRNNMFHGEKDVASLERQLPLFRLMNDTLMFYMDLR